MWAQHRLRPRRVHPRDHLRDDGLHRPYLGGARHAHPIGVSGRCTQPAQSSPQDREHADGDARRPRPRRRPRM
eukprot:5099501-Heterocapsa_arctica.AAC.1